ncbi:MAG: PorV/PorQ family protein [Ignavibacteriaceae bacterium]|nr:PorV/PorQ family protein [Ignavibacteriaceae bacterium]
MNFFRIIIVIVCLSFASVTNAQIGGAQLNKSGTTSAQFLKIGVGPRAIGMGGAYTALADDINAMYWNPAGLAKMYSREAYFNHVDWISDVNLDYAGFGMNINEFGTVGAFVSIMSMGDMKVRTLQQPEGTGEMFSAGAVVIGLSYAKLLTEEFAIGFNAKYINEYIWNENAIGFAFDIGTVYTIPFLNQFRLAASISNFGPKMKLQGRDILVVTTVGAGQGNVINTDLQLEEFELPLIFRFGIAVDAIKAAEHRLTLAVDAVHPNDNSESINTGLEYTWNEIFFVRGGYKSLFEENGEQGLTLGIGLNYRLLESLKVKIDYAYQDFGRLKNVQYISLGLRF